LFRRDIGVVEELCEFFGEKVVFLWWWKRGWWLLVCLPVLLVDLKFLNNVFNKLFVLFFVLDWVK